MDKLDDEDWPCCRSELLVKGLKFDSYSIMGFDTLFVLRILGYFKGCWDVIQNYK